VRQRTRLDAGKNALHFIDLLALRFDDLVAELRELGIADLRLAAHQDRSGVAPMIINTIIGATIISVM